MHSPILNEVTLHKTKVSHTPKHTSKPRLPHRKVTGSSVASGSPIWDIVRYEPISLWLFGDKVLVEEVRQRVCNHALGYSPWDNGIAMYRQLSARRTEWPG